MIKLLKIITIISLILAGSLNVYPEVKTSPKKNRVLIYNFSTTDKDLKDKGNNYQYYSIIIPDTISKSLQKSKEYEIIRNNEPFTIETVFPNDTRKRIYVKNLSKTGIKNKIDFIITGKYYVTGGKLKTKIVIFNVQGKDIVTVENESDELGVVLTQLTDLVSSQMSGNIDNLEKLNIKRADNSLSLAIYRPFSIMTLGLDAGYFYIFGDWSKVYKNSLFIAPFIDFDLADSYSVSLKFTSIQSDNENKDATSYSQIKILNGTVTFNYLYKISDNYGIVLSGGGGLARTTIIINPEQPFYNALAKKTSYDPTLDLSAYLDYTISPALFRAGLLYKRIFYKDKAMDSATVFAGAGIHF